MLNFNLDKMLFVIPAWQHDKEQIKQILLEHLEVQYVSFVGIDMGGHDTDEKIPVRLFIEDMDKMLMSGVQTDGSSVALPKIASLNNAKVDIIPDMDANWYVDYNYRNVDSRIGLPIGTLRLPSYILHDDSFWCGSRVMLRDALNCFKSEIVRLIKENPYVCQYMYGINDPDDIEDVLFTSATELEFWVKTPDDKGDREQLFTAEVLKEQYWKRTYGEVRTALEDTLNILDRYGFGVEMGHKEVGGVKAKMAHTGHYHHVMEQLEIDWKYNDALLSADNENHVKYVVRDIFTMHGLDVTFMAKPFDGVAGSGEHTHIGLAAKLRSGEIVNMFSAKDMEKDFLNPIGYGALMGLLKNYEVLNPFISSSNDALNRLKPGYEAPVCIVTSLGRTAAEPTRNRTVLLGLIRDLNNPNATRFELRSPNPKSNTYLVLATSYMAMLDGIEAALEKGKTPQDLEKSISKKYGEDDFYLEKYREYRSEKEVFEDFSQAERDKLFGKAPETVCDNMKAFELYPEKLEVLKRADVINDMAIESYREQILSRWRIEFRDRIIPENMALVRSCKRIEGDLAHTDYDEKNWSAIEELRRELGQNTCEHKCLLAQAIDALDNQQCEVAAMLQMEISEKVKRLLEMYSRYKKNIF